MARNEGVGSSSLRVGPPRSPRKRQQSEPAGEIASRELEIRRITGALFRADELTDDDAAVLEVVA